MGLPVGKLYCASNVNNVLSKFFSDGIYRGKGELKKTTSPSMDILVSSNLERLLYHCTEDAELVKGYMQELALGNDYNVGSELLKRFKDDFMADWADDAAAAKAIGSVYAEKGYLLDTHSAVGKAVYDTMAHESAHAVLVCTASPFKFSGDVMRAIGKEVAKEEDAAYELADATGLVLPLPLVEALTAEPRLLNTCAVAGMDDALLSWLDSRS